MLSHHCLIFSLPYNPYATLGPSNYAPDATLTPLTPPCTRPTCLQHCLPSLRLQCLPDMPLILLTILMLMECPPNMPPMPLTTLTLAVPSRHASNAPLTLA
ncbi:hypothetical protein O181_083116 [Austropuccinia psidii MF-1]|uniref:Uncharacterized protein n=1 Tax=Austropuccinia psidii MF-1 TaxID=1389203 RepID=A0A9Q3IHL0_9BASI|nr:hypothetical protein [Austropuccinia psidii MF-1]